MSGKTDIRWSDSEWAALQPYSEVVCGTPGKAVKWIVCQALREAGVLAASGQEIGSAAPRERGSRRAAELETGRVAVTSGLATGGDALGSGGDPGTGPAAASSRSAQRTTGGAEVFLAEASAATPDLMAELRASFDRVRRPEGSAGSSVPVPPAGGSAAGGAVAEPAEEGTRLLDAVAAALRAQGVTNAVELVARKAIRSGQVIVDGEACTDPERLVDPAALGGQA